MTRKLLIIIALTTVSNFLSSCSKTTVQQTPQQDLSTTITNGNWVVGKFVNDKTDLTSAFLGYLFEFGTNGTANAIQGGLTISGTWSGSISSLIFVQNYPGATDPIAKLNASWQILGLSTDTLVVKSNLDTLLLRKL